MLDCTPVLALALTHCRLIKQLFRCFHNQNVQFSDLNCIFKWISCNLQDFQVVPFIFCCIIRPGGDNKILGLANEHEIKNGSLIVAPKERVLPGLPPPPWPLRKVLHNGSFKANGVLQDKFKANDKTYFINGPKII